MNWVATIDWWRWWITTVVALPIAAVLFVVAVFAKRRELKGALLVAGLVAVGLGVASPFVMDSMGKGPRLTASEFAARADQNCRNLNNVPAANFGQPTPTPAFAAKLDTFMSFFWQALHREGQLRPPASAQDTASRWMDAMTAVGHDFEAMRDAAGKSDSAAFGPAGKRLSADASESQRLSKQLGETYCFQG
jgi:hypothetical protein